MPVSEFKIFLDNTAADDKQIDLFGEIKVDQAIGMATEAELEIPVGLNKTGEWSVLEEDFAQVFSRIRIEVKVRDSDFIALIDGPIVAQRFELSGSPNKSKMIIVVQDDSVLLNQNEAVEVFEDTTADDIAKQLFSDAGLNPNTDSISMPSSGLTQYLVQRGTAMQFLKELARQHSMFIYVEPGDEPGKSEGFFKRPDLTDSEYPELLLIGRKRNINKFDAHFDGLRPIKARVEGIDAADNSIVSATADASDIDPLGEEPSHDIVAAGESILLRTREANDAMDTATAAAVNHSSWAYTANAEVMASSYSAVLQPHRTISLAGAGGHLSGDWMISQVTHTLTDKSYKQSFGLRRNGRSAGSSGVTGGVF